jgi:hypothetical protein
VTLAPGPTLPPRQTPGDRRPGAPNRDQKRDQKRVLPTTWSWRRRTLSLQLVATVIILGWLPGNSVKLSAMLIIWAVGFGPVSWAELAVAGIVNLLFIAMDVAALRQGLFLFHHPDAIGLPFYEFFIWGFYIFHLVRYLGGPAARPRRLRWALGMALIFSACFSLIQDSALLAMAAAGVLVVCLLLFHEPMDLAFTTYMAGMGALVEYVGVGTGQWSYPSAPAGGVPIWSFAMWAGIGLFTRRILVPFLGSRLSID